MIFKRGKFNIKDWLIVGVALLDDVAALALILLVLWIFKIKLSLPIVIFLALLFGTLTFVIPKAIIPSLHKKRVAGAEAMIGLEGQVVESLTPSGVVKVAGELWKAKSVDGDVAKGEDVEVLKLNRLSLEVKRKSR